jgi:rhamnosyl/mannosyltransferase
MRVLQVSKFYSPIRGGIESATLELAEGLNRAGVPTDVLCANTSSATERERAEAGFTIVRAGSLGRVLSTSMAPSMISQVGRLCPHYDVVHVHMPDPMAALALWLAKPQARLVVHWHSDVVRQRLSLKFYEPLQRWLLKRADAIIATSPAYVESSSALRPWRSKVEVIPIGISDNAASVRPEQVARLRARYGGRRIVFALGRMAYYKGFDVLIDAALRLPDDCVVLIGGAGGMLDRLRTRVASDTPAGKVHLLGPIEQQELVTHFAAADVFCLPSIARSEAYGVVMVEAMSMGKPVVSTEIPGSGVSWVNLEGVTGMKVPVGSPQALADALCLILADEGLRERMGAAARHHYIEHFSAAEMTRRTVSLYRRLLAS